ncbi:MAG: beta-ketoacyl-[acyl-carrier-protein] synthase family protein [Chlorobi bacterium]|nr:beta-ketoacyl-[acyl-carrier-protein] synthase family protein [Chlorobiota bacterium]
MSVKIVITGIGIISSIGRNAEETFDSLVNGKSGIKKISILTTIHKDSFVAGEIPLTNDELIEQADTNLTPPFTRTALLGMIAAKQAWKDAGTEKDDDGKTGLISATTVGGMDRSELFYKDFLNKDEPNPYIDTHNAGNSTEMIARDLHISDYLTTISTACSSSLNSIIFGARLIENGVVDRVIAGGTDALSKFTLNGFNSLLILDKNRCRPFDDKRSGLNLGEGAAYLVLEKEEDALKKGKKIYARLEGFANANDAFHQTASSDEGEGPFLAMKKALQRAGLSPADIDYINVHGTGTENNDLTESRAMMRLFGEKIPDFSSTKAFTGHTLGAAGALEAVISILALQNGLMFPNLNFGTPIPETGLTPVRTVVKKEIKYVLTNSFGFGGNDSSAVFSWPDFKEKKSPLKSVPTRLEKPVYIIGTGSVAPQETLDPDHFLDELISVEDKYLQIKKPNYRDYIHPKALRRMSKIVRMGMISAKTAIEDAKTEQPGAIVTGTGMGCQRDTEIFLNTLLDNDEKMVNPSAFIQSTHNAISAQIALMLGNTNHNMAYVHRTFSFESALMDGMVLINKNEADNILVGGIDEITEESWLLKTRLDYFKKNPVNNLKLLDDKQPGALAGESASFFVLASENSETAYAQLVGVDTLFRPSSKVEIWKRIESFLKTHNLKTSDIDLVLLGYNGDPEFDPIYDETARKLFENKKIAYYKHLCGEHDTSSAFAVWIGAMILKSSEIPEIILKEGNTGAPVKNILIYNHFRNINHSLILLSKA